MNKHVKLFIILILFLAITLYVTSNFNFYTTSDTSSIKSTRFGYNIFNWNIQLLGNAFDTTNDRREPTIFCMILTSPNNLDTKAIFIQKAWAHKCDMSKFITIIPKDLTSLTLPSSSSSSSLHNNSIQLVEMRFDNTSLSLLQPAGFLSEDYNKLTDKVYLTLRDVYRLYDNYDYYLKADDDTFVFVDNLRQFLKEKNTSHVPITYGYNFKVLVENGYHSGGGGYVLTHESLSRLGKKLSEQLNFCPNSGTEDVDVAKCLRLLKVFPGNSTDEKGRERFHPLSVSNHFQGEFPDWLYQYSSNGVFKGAKCCSDSSISFHYMNPSEIMKLASLLKKSNHTVTFKEIVTEFGMPYSENERRRK